MLIMYEKTGCPYCHKVDVALEKLGLSPERRNIADDAAAEELVQRGGKRQVPYIIDEEHKTEMYESDDIVEYLERTYGKKE